MQHLPTADTMLLKQAIINHEIGGSRVRIMYNHTAGKFIISSHNYIVLSPCNPITRHAIQETSYQSPNRIRKFYETSHFGT